LYACLEQHGPKEAKASFQELITSLEQDTPSMEMIRVLIEDPNIEVYLTGGILRDAAAGKAAKDYDWVIRVKKDVKPPREYFEHIFTQEKLEGVRKVKRVKDARGNITEKVKINNKYGTLVLAGERFGVYKFRGKDGIEHDIAFPRTEEATASGVGGRNDFEAQIAPHMAVVGPEGELSRRDFDFNAMALKIELADDGSYAYEFYDEFGGLKSLLEDKELKCVGEPKDRFREDMSRMLRACRQAAKLDIPLSQDVFDAIQKYAEHINDNRADGRRVVSHEIVSAEFLKGLYLNPEQFLHNLYETGLLQQLVPWFDHETEPIVRRGQSDLKAIRSRLKGQEINTPRTQEIRHEAFEQAMEIIGFGRKHFGKENWRAEDSLLVLYLHLARCKALEETLPDGRKIYPDAHLLAQLMLNTDRYHLLSISQFAGPEQRRKYGVDYQPIRDRLDNWPSALNLLASEEPGPAEKASMLKIFPNLAEDPLWKVLYATIAVSPDTTTARERLSACEQALFEVSDSKERIAQLTEELVGTNILREQLHFLPKGELGRKIGELKRQGVEYVRFRCGGEGVCDPTQLKAEFLWRYLINEGAVREHWQKHFEIDQMTKKIFPDTDSEEVHRAALRAVEQLVCEQFVGVPYSRLPDLLESIEMPEVEREQLKVKAAGGGLSELIITKLQTDPETPGKLFGYLQGKNQRQFFEFFWPELAQIVGVPQDARWHSEGAVDVHTLLVLGKLHEQTQKRGRMPTREETVAALLHDSGKAETVEEQSDGRITFYRHEKHSAEAVERCAERFGWQNTLDVELIKRAVRNHMKPFQIARSRGIKLQDVLDLFPLGTEDPLFYLLEADATASVPSDTAERDENRKMLTQIEDHLPTVDTWRNAGFTWNELAASDDLGVFAQNAKDGRFREAVLVQLQTLSGEMDLSEITNLPELLWEKIMLNYDWAVLRYVSQKLLPTTQVQKALIEAGVPEHQIGRNVGGINRAAIPGFRNGQLTQVNSGAWLEVQAQQAAGNLPA